MLNGRERDEALSLPSPAALMRLRRGSPPTVTHVSVARGRDTNLQDRPPTLAGWDPGNGTSLRGSLLSGVPGMNAPETRSIRARFRGNAKEDLTPDLLRLGAALVTFVAALAIGFVR
jgi:hypothetical protein